MILNERKGLLLFVRSVLILLSFNRKRYQSYSLCWFMSELNNGYTSIPATIVDNVYMHIIQM